MRIYAERPARAVLQVLADVALLAWALLVAHIALAVRAAVLALQGPAQRLTGAGEDIRGTFDGAARTAAGLPFVGEDLARALGTGTDAGDSLAASGRDLAASVTSAATGVGGAIVLVGILPVVLLWFALRARWVRAASSARLARSAGPDLLALHALTRRSTRTLLRVGPDPAAAWRAGDPAVVAALAGIELRALGLRAPDRPLSPSR